MAQVLCFRIISVCIPCYLTDWSMRSWQMFRLGVPNEYRSSSPSNSHYTMLGDLEQPWRLTSSALTPDLSPRYARQSSVNDQFLGSAIFQPGALFRSEHLENYVLEVRPYSSPA